MVCSRKTQTTWLCGELSTATFHPRSKTQRQTQHKVGRYSAERHEWVQSFRRWCRGLSKVEKKIKEGWPQHHVGYIARKREIDLLMRGWALNCLVSWSTLNSSDSLLQHGGCPRVLLDIGDLLIVTYLVRLTFIYNFISFCDLPKCWYLLYKKIFRSKRKYKSN